jgi:hypothetical protein
VLLASTADIIGVHIAMDIMATAATHIATTAAITVIATTATITIIGATIITIIAIGKTCRAARVEYEFMVSAWPEPPSAMSAEKSAGVRDGMEAFALTTTKTPPNYAGEYSGMEWPLQTGGPYEHTS